jgi:hypothetical protein
MNPSLNALLCLCAFLLMISMALSADPSPTPSASRTLPTLQDEIAKGFIPYHQLTIEDFPINDQVHREAGFWVKTFVHPYWWAQYRFAPNSIYAYIGEWVVFSGLDKNESSHKSWLQDMKSELPYAQALLDINEIHARRLAALKSGELPRGEGASLKATRANLVTKIHLFCQREFAQIQAEMDEFAKATNKGSNQKKVRELAAEIKKRLASLPVANASPSSAVSAAPAGVATAPSATRQTR